MDPDWFMHETAERTRYCDFPPLITTCSDGDNGGWFRNTNWSANYWGSFYQPLMERVRQGNGGIVPTFIDDYLDRHGAAGSVTVHPGAWNTGDHSGSGFVQWTGSQDQRDALERVAEISRTLCRDDNVVPVTADVGNTGVQAGSKEVRNDAAFR